MPRNRLLRRGIASAISISLFGVAPRLVFAQSSYPDHQIRLIVGTPAGGNIDLLARIVGEQLGKQMKQAVIVENKAGAGGNIGAAYVANSPPDGYTLFMSVIGTMAINPSLYRSMPFDPIRSFAAISQLSFVPQIMIINKSVPANNLKEFIAYEHQHSGQLNFASGGIGTATHLAGVLFNAMAGTKLVHVPFKGGAPAMTELLSGRSSVMFEQISTSLPHVRDGSLRAMGVTTLKRSPAAPDIPSLSEAGLTGYDISTWHGLVAPAGTPAAIVNRLHDEVVRALASPDVTRRLSPVGIVPVSSTPAQFAAFTQAELVKWTAIVKSANIPQE